MPLIKYSWLTGPNFVERCLRRKNKLILRTAGSKKNAIFGQNFPKSAQKHFSTDFFKKFACDKKTFGQNKISRIFWECSENQFG